MTEKNQNTINNTLMFQMHFQLAVLESYRLKSEEKYEFEAFKSNIVIENDTKYDTLYADQHKEPVFYIMTIYDDRPKFNGISWDNGEFKWHNFGPFVQYGPYVYKVCLTSWGARRLVKRYTRKGKVAW